MKLALAEMRRRPGRWGSIIGAVGFIVFLVLVLAALADGLFIGTAGAIATGDSDALVYSIDGRRSLVRSELPVSDVARVAEVEGVADVGGLGVLLSTAGTGVDIYDIAVMGHIPGHAGEPTQFVEGRRLSTSEQFVGIADVSIQEAGVSLGDSVTLTGSSQPIEIIGFVENARYLLAATVWVPLETWQALRLEVRPETAGRGPIVQAIPILVEPDETVAAVGAAVDAVLETTETVSKEDAVLSLPGVDQQQSTFSAIIIVSFVVVGIVIALFFALITLEKRGQFAILKAIGSPNRLLLQGVLVQALIATVAGYALGWGLSRLLAFALPSTVPVEFLTQTALSLFLSTIVMGAIGATFSFRKIIGIDPASALGGEA